MEEVITRRYSRMVEQGDPLPDLIVVDGGKGQLRFAYEALERMGLADQIALVGLAKRIEEVFFPHDSNPYYIDRHSEALKVLMHIRDEAHRFGITFHRNKRSKAFIKSGLEGIDGVGERTIEKLLKHYRTIARLQAAPIEEVAALVGKARAEALARHWKREEQGDTPQK